MKQSSPDIPIRVSIFIGTRPELIKLAVLIKSLRRSPSFHTRVVFSGQHTSLLEQMADFFHISCDRNLCVMQKGQGLGQLTARLVQGISDDLREHPADVVIAQGDTCTVLAAATAALYAKVPFAHVEAGLRSGRLSSPHPEEGIRRMVSSITSMHFAPTDQARVRLLREGIEDNDIYVTGNTGIDTLLETLRQFNPAAARRNHRKRVVVTLHRRENQGPVLRGILGALKAVLQADPRVELFLPVHPNPRVDAVVRASLGNHPRIHLLQPMDYGDFVGLMASADLIMTDSGGVQEEAPSLQVPILVLRDTTERPEGVAAGVSRLVGTEPSKIRDEALRELAAGSERYGRRPANPYGDGRASERIVAILERKLSQQVTAATKRTQHGEELDSLERTVSGNRLAHTLHI